MKSRKRLVGEMPHKCHFVAVLLLKNISRPAKKIRRAHLWIFNDELHNLVGTLGIEPSLREPESRVLPVYYVPINS